jgi:hypothetical protein
MLVPLETLSGWPQAPEPTILQILGLFVGIPLLIFVVVIAIAKIDAAAHAGRGDISQASDPLWVGAHESAELEAAGANPSVGDQATEATAGDEKVAAEEVRGDDTGEHVGGAGARW